MVCSRRVSFAVVGVGNIGALHAENLALKIPNARLEAIVDSNKNRLYSLATKLNVKKLYTDYDLVLKDDAVEALVLAVPTYLKQKMIEKAILAKKHIFVEKPMVLNLTEAEEIARLLRKSKIKFQVGYQRRFDRAFLLAKDQVKSGSLGVIQFVMSRTRDPPGNFEGWLSDPNLSGGIWLDTLSHDFDIIHFVTSSRVSKVYAEASTLVYEELRKKGDYDNVVVAMRLDNGALACVDSCAYTPYGYDIRFEIVGTKSAVVIGGATNSPYKALSEDAIIADITRNYVQRFERAYRDELEDFARCIIMDDTPKVGFDEGYAAIKVALSAWQAFKMGKPISLSW